jgi:hypothetical protein
VGTAALPYTTSNQDSSHLFSGQQGIDFDRQEFAHTFIQKIQRSKPTPYTGLGFELLDA